MEAQVKDQVAGQSRLLLARLLLTQHPLASAAFVVQPRD
jgi:hypothetical protein